MSFRFGSSSVAAILTLFVPLISHAQQLGPATTGTQPGISGAAAGNLQAQPGPSGVQAQSQLGVQVQPQPGFQGQPQQGFQSQPGLRGQQGVQAQFGQNAPINNNQGENWRYKFHNGHWWYWMPNNTWVFWNGSSWTAYSPDAYNNFYSSQPQTYSNGYGYAGGGQQYSNGGYYGGNYFGPGWYGYGYGPYGYGYNRGAATGAGVGSIVGGAVGGYPGAAVGAGVGAAIGSGNNRTGSWSSGYRGEGSNNRAWSGNNGNWNDNGNGGFRGRRGRR